MLPQLQVKTLYLLEIFGTNHKPMANRYNQDDSDSCQSGVFLNVYKINHACTPNAILSYFPEARVMRIYAVKALSKGEEVFIPYCDVSKTYVTRRRLLKFDCQCSTCKSPNRDDSDLRRQIISASRKQLLRDDHKLQTLPRHHDIDDIAWFRTKAYDHLKRVRDENLYHSYYEAYAFVAFFELHSRNGEASMEYIQLVQREDELCNGGIGSKPLEYLINTWYEKYGTINMASLTQGSRIC
ncbi:hypothetical protein GQX73_g1783 [Xylaria multiplex]|uniref:SET domain-containing protein n=1 Tax=Xylaria multiplex TaxID=323545 RepID=A0A7C8MYQ7_9PEZI|nr:hypothetical protein GQX73_g1783 [Xylaria multiplex]